MSQHLVIFSLKNGENVSPRNPSFSHARVNFKMQDFFFQKKVKMVAEETVLSEVQNSAEQQFQQKSSDKLTGNLLETS